jgi:pSer/pThr/pTyr-binding forkhead associated (FHA) protein
MYRLIFLNGNLKGRRVAVQQGALLIGRDPSCQLDLQEDDQVSHQHALLEQRSDGVWIKDLGATNRTEVNGQPVEEVRLHPGDRIEIGHTQMEFQLIEAQPESSRRRVSMVQVLTFVAIGVVFTVQGLFMFIQFARSPVQTPVPPPAPGLSTNDLEPDLQRALAMREQDEAAAATGTVDQVQVEVAELRAAVADLREQLGDMEGTTSNGAVVVSMDPTNPPPAIPSAVAEVETEEAFPQREPPPPLIDVPVEPSVRPADEDPLQARAEELLELAKADIARSNLTGADLLLERIQVMAPDFLPAYIERAKLYEKRAMLNKAGEQWALIMERSKGTPLYATAVAVRQRLAQAEVAVSTARKTLEERPVAARLPRRIRIVSIDRERFPASKEIDEMRLVRVNVKPRPNEAEIAVDQFELRVTFFDRVIGTDQVEPTGATVPHNVLRPEGRWPANEARALTATYILKKGFRLLEQQRTGDKRMYEGYRVQLFYQGELQDEDAQPRTLLKLTPPAPEISTDTPVPR